MDPPPVHLLKQPHLCITLLPAHPFPKQPPTKGLIRKQVGVYNIRKLVLLQVPYIGSGYYDTTVELGLHDDVVVGMMSVL